MIRKHIALPIRTLFSLLLFCSFFWSCDETDDALTPAPYRSVVAAVEEQNNLSAFYAALTQAGLLNTLQNQNVYFTLFAPDNNAITSFLQERGYASLDQVPAAELTALIDYHVALGYKTAASLDSATFINTLSNNRDIFFTSRGNNVIQLNDQAGFLQNDLLADNGVVHVIDEVLLPPTQTLAELISMRAGAEVPEYTFLKAALEQANLLTALDDQQQFTLLAPTDAAFQNAGFATVEDLQSADPSMLRRILLYHLLPGYRFSYTIMPGNINTQLGQGVTVNADGTVTGAGNVQAANFIPAEGDVLTENGIVQGIDALLLP